MTPEQASSLATRTLAVIDTFPICQNDSHRDADRARVASDLAGLTYHDLGCGWCRGPGPACPDAHRYADGLVRTAALYGVT